jgi:hypothetical protein
VVVLVDRSKFLAPSPAQNYYLCTKQFDELEETAVMAHYNGLLRHLRQPTHQEMTTDANSSDTIFSQHFAKSS